MRGGAANALRAAAHGEAFVTADGGEDETESERFHEALHEVAEFERVNGTSPKLDGTEAQRKNGRGAAAEKADKIGEAGEERLHENGGEDARRDEFAAGVGAHGAHGVDLLGDEHGAEFGGDARSAAAGDEDAGEGGAEFADESDGDDVAGERRLAEARELRAGLQNHDDADEKAGEKDDGERADADVVHLIEKILEVVRAAKKIGEGLGGEVGIGLNVGDEVHRAIG